MNYTADLLKVSLFLLAFIVAIGVLYLFYVIKSIENWISHYENQGFEVYPGSRKWLLGMLNVFQLYDKLRASVTVVEMP